MKHRTRNYYTDSQKATSFDNDARALVADSHRLPDAARHDIHALLRNPRRHDRGRRRPHRLRGTHVRNGDHKTQVGRVDRTRLNSNDDLVGLRRTNSHGDQRKLELHVVADRL